MRPIQLRQGCLVAVMGCAGSGKSTFARRHFQRYQVLSSDVFRGLVADDEGDQAATPDAFDALYFVAGRRLARGLLTVVDATNATTFARARVLGCARAYEVRCVAVVLNLPPEVCVERAALRSTRPIPESVVRSQHESLLAAVPGLLDEGFDEVHVLGSTAEVEAATVRITPERQAGGSRVAAPEEP